MQIITAALFDFKMADSMLCPEDKVLNTLSKTITKSKIAPRYS